MPKYLVTGAAGFIGYHVCQRLLGEADSQVLAIDNLNDYYEVSLKEARLANLKTNNAFQFRKGDVADNAFVSDAFKKFQPDFVIHLAAQVGVRYSLENPAEYIRSNIDGFSSMLVAAQESKPKHFVFASSSSVYGANVDAPFSETSRVDLPLNLYAATKVSNEMMAHSFSYLYGIPMTGLRFFTVYGPWGRPDMALFLFTRAILKGEPLSLFNQGRMKRDFTYVEDVSKCVFEVTHKIPTSDPKLNNSVPFRILNVARGKTVELMEYVKTLEILLGKKAEVVLKPLNKEEMVTTHGDISKIKNLINYQPNTDLDVGLSKFVEWYKSYYKDKFK